MYFSPLKQKPEIRNKCGKQFAFSRHFIISKLCNDIGCLRLVDALTSYVAFFSHKSHVVLSHMKGHPRLTVEMFNKAHHFLSPQTDICLNSEHKLQHLLYKKKKKDIYKEWRQPWFPPLLQISRKATFDAPWEAERLCVKAKKHKTKKSTIDLMVPVRKTVNCSFNFCFISQLHSLKVVTVKNTQTWLPLLWKTEKKHSSIWSYNYRYRRTTLGNLQDCLLEDGSRLSSCSLLTNSKDIKRKH